MNCIIRATIKLILLVGMLMACGPSDSPEMAAKEWMTAFANLDGNKLAERTCASQQANVQRAGMQISILGLFSQHMMDQQAKIDISGLSFSTLESSGNSAHVQVTGQIRVAILALSQTQVVDETWQMVKEGERWKWCGQADAPVNQSASATSAPQSSVHQVEVFANRGWQDTGIVISRGQQVTIEYVSGLWFEDPPGHWRDASGGPNPWTCSMLQCNEPLRDFPKYALIGRLGDSVLKVGNRLDFVAEFSGNLQLRPNYSDSDIRIHNPQGSVTLKITVR